VSLSISAICKNDFGNANWTPSCICALFLDYGTGICDRLVA
jgi:hypothetical protein